MTFETSLGPQSPAAPDGLSAIDENSIDPWAQIVLSWTDLLDNKDNFVIERSTNGGNNYDFLTIVGADVSEYADPNVEVATEYCYRVKATNTGGDSGYSNSNCAMTRTAKGGLSDPVADMNGNGIVDQDDLFLLAG